MKLVHPLVPAGRLEIRRSPNRGGRTALSAYRPMRLRGRVLSLASRVSVPRVSLVDATQEELLLIRAAVPSDADGFCLMRSSAPDRWIVAVSRADALSEVVKVGSPTDRGLVIEAAMLRDLGHPSGFDVPQLVSQSVAHGRSVVSTRAVVGAPRRELHVATRVAVGLANLGLTHGDFAPWNLLGQAPTLIDWESAEWTLRPMYDLCHFVVQSEALLGRGRVTPVLKALTSRGSAGALYLVQLGRPLEEAVDHLVAYLDEADRRGTFMKSADLRSRLRTALK